MEVTEPLTEAPQPKVSRLHASWSLVASLGIGIGIGLGIAAEFGLASGRGFVEPISVVPAEGVISYVHLWVDADGETHLEDCEVKNLTLKNLPGGESPQYVRSLTETVANLGATNTIVTQMIGPNPWHHCPQPQFVVVLAGSWYVNTTDGDQRHLPMGSWLWQDDSAKHPAAMEGTHRAMHFSEADAPCSQMILQLKKKPRIGHVCPF